MSRFNRDFFSGNSPYESDNIPSFSSSKQEDIDNMAKKQLERYRKHMGLDKSNKDLQQDRNNLNISEDIIYYLHTYIPYRNRHNIEESNNSYNIIQFKYGNLFAIEYYRNKLVNHKFFKKLSQCENMCISCIPPHNPYKKDTSMYELGRILCEDMGFINAIKCCNRVKFINKLSNGGCRDKEVHLNSIKIIDKEIISNKSILLIDDITTTGNSMNACQELLKQNGAKNVYKFALAHTPKLLDNSYKSKEAFING